MNIIIDPRVVTLLKKKNKTAISIWLEGCGG